MLRDDRRKAPSALNVLREPLAICLFQPMTGFYRDGCCNTDKKTLAAAEGGQSGGMPCRHARSGIVTATKTSFGM